MEDKHSENPDDITHSGPIPSDIETAKCSSSLQNVETDKDINRDIDDLYKAAVEGKIEVFDKYNKKKTLKQLLTANNNTILHIHITARPLDFVEGIPKLIHKLFPRAQETRVLEKTWSEYFLEKIHELIDKLFPHAQKMAQSKKESSLKFVEEILEMCPALLWQVNIKDETLLHIASRHGHDDIVDFLLKKSKEAHHNDQEMGVGAARQMLTMTNKAKDTALHEAVRFKHLHVVERLIDEDHEYSYGANDAGETPIYLAIERGYQRIALTLDLELGPSLKSVAESGGPRGRTALHAAVLRNDLAMTWLILFNGSTLVREKDKGGWIPLHYAAYYGYIRIVRLLLNEDKSTAYVTTANGEKTALHIAASRGNVDTMKMIISRCRGCSELVDERGWNVLHFAMESRNPKAVKLVLENPSLSNLINQLDTDGNTPLHQLAALGFYMPSFISHPKVDKQAFSNQKAVNGQHLNALDITLRNGLFSKEQKYLKNCLQGNGIIEGQRLLFNKDVVNKDEGDREGDGPSSDDRKGTKKDDIIADIKEAKEAHLVVATLIATVTFAAGFTVPGGYKGEGSPDPGTATLTKSAAFKAFVITDTIAMMLSSSAVFLHLFMALDRDKARIISQFIQELHFTIFAMYAMVVAFITGTYAILAPSSWLAITTCVLGCIFCLLYGYFISRSIFDLLEFLSEKITSLRRQSSKAELDKVKKSTKKSKS